MKREQKPVKGRISALNIVTHPHTPAKYAKLFQDAFTQKLIVSVHGDHHALIHSCALHDKHDATAGMSGEIYRFLDIKPNEEWYNLIKDEVASKQEKETITIPPHLKPKLKRIHYSFYPEVHRLLFMSDLNHENMGGMSPAWMLRFMEQVLLTPKLSLEFPEILITIEQSPGKLDRILKTRGLKLLEIQIKKPNGDDPGEFAGEVLQHLVETKAQQQIITLKGSRNREIEPSEKTKALGTLALSNGQVYAESVDTDGVKHQHSTQETPLAEKLIWVPKDNMTLRKAFLEAAASMKDRFLKK